MNLYNFHPFLKNPMIEPVLQGAELIGEIEQTCPGPESLSLWWLGQSGFLIKSGLGTLVVDPYLSEHLTKKYEGTARPHVRMTRAPLRGGDLKQVDVVLASHKHSDHLDPGTLPDLMAASPDAVLLLPDSLLEHAEQMGLPAGRLTGSMPGGRRRSPGSGFAPCPRHTSRSTAIRGKVSLSGIRHRVRGPQAVS